ncbi:MAG: DNA-binding protein [Nitrospirae bacterium YQR-1]
MIKKISILAIALILGLAATASAQPWRGWKGSCGWGQGSTYQRMYDPSTAATVTGTIEAVETFKAKRGMAQGLHLVLTTEDGKVAVHLGPVWYIERQDVELRKGDTVEVKGSKITFNSKPAIIAAEVKKDDEVLKLRDESGIPYWAGSGMGGRMR